jgi:hypothetical protein
MFSYRGANAPFGRGLTGSPVDVVLSRLERVRRSGGGWEARCPAHEDRSPSLSVRVGDDGRVLVYCHAGCRTEDVVAAIGLSRRDLFAHSGRRR